MKTAQIYLGLLMMLSFVFIQSSWWNIYSTTSANNNYASQEDVIKNAASNRLAALQENRLKHAKIHQEETQGKYGSEKNFETISKKEQDVLDQQVKKYFEQSWISVEDASNIKNQLTIDKFFNDNKELIKENYRLAQKLTDPEIMYIAIEFLSKLPIEDIIAMNGLALINIARQIPQLKNKAEAAAMFQITFKDRFFIKGKPHDKSIFYKKIKDKITQKYKIIRSGVDNKDIFVPDNSKEDVMDYVNRIKIFDAIIKSNMDKDKNNEILLKHLKKENVILFKMLEEGDVAKAYKLSKKIINNKIPEASDFIDNTETFVNDPTIKTGYDLAKSGLKTVQPFISSDMSEHASKALDLIDQTEKFVDLSQSISQDRDDFIANPNDFIENKLA